MQCQKIGWMTGAVAAAAALSVSAPLSAQTNARGEQIVMGTGMTRTINVTGKSLIVRGDNNRITWSGHTPLLRVYGNGNRVYGQSAHVIQISGRNNSVYWSKRYNGRSPRVSKTGSGNWVSFDKNGSPKR